MGTAILEAPSTRVRGGVPLGAPTRLSCAAAGVSSGLAGAVKAAIAKSKLCKIEAKTVQCEFAERRKMYTEYVPFWASFGIRIQEYVWNTSGILRIRAEYSPLGGRLEYVEYVFTQ